jgi:hypothetical protein
MRAALVSAAIAVLLGSCQRYELEEITPKFVGARTQRVPIKGLQKPPKIMLALDRSGSMKYTSSSDSTWGCCASVVGATCVGYDVAGGCKWNDLKSLLVDPGNFLDSTEDKARHGLAVFPDTTTSSGAAACTEGKVLVEVGALSSSTVGTIKSRLGDGDLAPSGGTPSAALLAAILGNYAFMLEEPVTERYVILITDGMPNCNSALDGQTCPCTSADCSTSPLSCLDDRRMVDAVARLKAKGVDTFVIGFGSAVNNPAAKQVLDQAAEAGGWAQSNQPTKFYQAGSKVDLQKILDEIKAVIQACTFTLDTPLDNGNLLEADLLDTQSPGSKVELARGKDWTLDCADAGANQSPMCPTDGVCGAGTFCWQGAGRCQGRCTNLGRVVVEGAMCQTLQNAEPGRYTLELISVRELP